MSRKKPRIKPIINPPAPPEVWWKRISWLEILIGALIGALLSTAIAIYVQKQQNKKNERIIVEKLITHVNLELTKNFSLLQIKGGQSFGMLADNTKDMSLLRLKLGVLKIMQFDKNAMKAWGQDLKVLLSFGIQGKATYDSILSAYDYIDKSEKNEMVIMDLIEKEQNVEKRKIMLNQLHVVHDVLRSKITDAINSTATLKIK